MNDTKESSDDSKENSNDSKGSSDDSKESSVPAVTNETFSSFRFWIVYLWIFGILGFLAVIYAMFLGRKGPRKRGKNYKHKIRPSYSGYMDMNGHDRHLRNAEFS